MERAVPQASYMPLPKAERFQTQQKRGNREAVGGTAATRCLLTPLSGREQFLETCGKRLVCLSRAAFSKVAKVEPVISASGHLRDLRRCGGALSYLNTERRSKTAPRGHR